MPKFPPPVTTLSGLEIDTDKDWAARRIENLGAPTGDGHAARLDTSINRHTANETVTVGGAGDFATINAAIEYLSKKYPLYTSGGYTAEISLLAGFTAAEQVFIRGLDLGWIRITSAEPVQAITVFANGGAGFTIVTIAGHGYANGDVVRITGTTNYNGAWNVSAVAADTFNIDTTFVIDDATGDCKRATNIDRSALITASPIGAPLAADTPNYPFLCAYYNASLPTIDVLFNMDTSGVAGKQSGCIIGYNSRAVFLAYSGVMNAACYGVCVWKASSCTSEFQGTFWKGAGNRGIYVVGTSMGVFPYADVSGSQYGIACDGVGKCDVMYCKANDCTIYGFYLTGASEIQALESEVKDSGDHNVYVGNGCTLHGRDVVWTGATNYNLMVSHACTVQVCSADLRNAGTYAIHCTGAIVDAFQTDVSGAGTAPYAVRRGGKIIDRYGYLRAKNQPLVVSYEELGALPNGNRIRVRLDFDATEVYQIMVSFSGFANNAGDRTNCIKKVFTGAVAVAAIVENSSTLLHNSEIVDGECVLTHTGANAEVDVIVQHPATHATAISKWVMQIEIETAGDCDFISAANE